MKKYILFDHDGVLVETELWYYKANERALAEIGITLSRDLYLSNMACGISSWELAREANISEHKIGLSRASRNQYYQEYLKSENIEIEGVLSTLKELSKNYSMAIITTSKRKDFDLIHQNRNIIDYMEFALTVEDYKNAKPHPEPYLAGLNRFNASPSEAVVIEDSARGLKSAVAAGIDCIVVDNEFTSSHDFSTATAKVESFMDLPQTIKGLTNKSTGNCEQ